MFRIPNSIIEDLAKYKASLADFLSNGISSDRFKGIRVPWGIYSHRGGKSFMLRIRIPAGVLFPNQLKALATAARKYGDGNLHLTTRQDIQLHSVAIEDTADAMEFLNSFHLSPRGGGGNTVRNITSCPLSGVCPKEIFDVSPYAVGLTEHLLREETSYNLPRKLKIAFSGCTEDCAGCRINDVGFLSRRNNGTRGFTVFTGGGLGASSRLGKALEEFIPDTEIGYCVVAIRNIFYRRGDRKNKHHNRLRFLIEEIGFDEFKAEYRQELNRLKSEEYISLRTVEPLTHEEADSKTPKGGHSDYLDFLQFSVTEQKQKGYFAVELRVPRGDIPFDRAEALTNLEHDFPGIEFRTSQNQNLFIVWIKLGNLPELFKSLKAILPDFLYPSTLLDVLSCKGALTCNLGLCNSPDLAAAIEQMIREEFVGKKIFRTLEIKLNGCPNACGHHPIGRISFHGVVRRIGKKPVPFYKILLGGRKDFQDPHLAVDVGIIPARNIPSFLKEFLREIDGAARSAEDVQQLLTERGANIAEEILRKYDYVPPYEENREFYIDWGKNEEFSLEGLTKGECGAGVLDMIESDLSDAAICLEEAEKRGFDEALVKRSIFLAARSLLIVKGIDPKNEEEALVSFKKKFVDRGIASGHYANIWEIFSNMKTEADEGRKKVDYFYAKKFVEHIKALYERMDSNFHFPQDASLSADGRVEALDLKGTPCPLNYVKAKLVIEEMKNGEVLEILLDEGEPIENVPRSLEADGHQILLKEKVNGFYRLQVKKA